LAFASLVIGCTTVVPQVLIPYAARSTPPELRSQTVSILMTGLLSGILLCRALAGSVGQIWGWRAMYGIAGIMMFILAIALRIILKKVPAAASLSYPLLVLSVLEQIPKQPLLRHSAVVAFLLFTSFGGFWTMLTYQLEKTFHYETWMIGFFGLIGAAGVFGASSAGRWVALYGSGRMITTGLIILLMGHMILMTGQWTVAGIMLGLIIVDFGAQLVMVSNQSQVYSLPSEFHSRLNTVYMVSVFLGMSTGTWLSLKAWNWGGWIAVCSLAMLTGLAALLANYLLRPQASKQGNP
jgi:predicted MFS family arabinose efflux permease